MIKTHPTTGFLLSVFSPLPHSFLPLPIICTLISHPSPHLSPFTFPYLFITHFLSPVLFFLFTIHFPLFSVLLFSITPYPLPPLIYYFPLPSPIHIHSPVFPSSFTSHFFFPSTPDRRHPHNLTFSSAPPPHHPSLGMFDSD